MENPFQTAEEGIVEICLFAFIKALIDEVGGVIGRLSYLK